MFSKPCARRFLPSITHFLAGSYEFPPLWWATASGEFLACRSRRRTKATTESPRLQNKNVPLDCASWRDALRQDSPALSLSKIQPFAHCYLGAGADFIEAHRGDSSRQR